MAKIQAERSTWQKARKLFNDIHLWLGLASGLIVFVICFSGTLYTFNTEITEWGAPHLYKVKNYEGRQQMPADSLLKKVESLAGGKVSMITIPASPGRTYQFNIKNAGDNRRGPGTTWFVNPYTGEMTGTSKDKNRARDFMSTLFSMHRWLLLDKVETPIVNGTDNRRLGSMITGWATIIFTLGCITGLIIWFPQKIKYWKQGLKIKWNAGWKRVNHDLHNTLAFYSLFFLLLMGLTGPQWSFEWYRNGLQKTLGTYKPENNTKEIPTGERDNKEKKSGKKDRTADSTAFAGLSLADYLQEGDKLLPYPGNYTISLPGNAGAKTTITKTTTGFFAPVAGDRITVDPHSGKVIKVDIFSKKPFNERVAGSIRAIHTGNVYGTFTKIIYFIACLIATSLPVTGTMIWLNKMKKTKKGKAEPPAPPAGEERVD